VTIRVTEKSYERFSVPENMRKNKFLYWRSNLPVDIFMKLVDENTQKKFESFYRTWLGFRDPITDTVSFLRQVVVSLPIGEKTFKIPAGFWEFHFDNLRGVRKQVVEFALDEGVGERTSFGLGFFNALHGSETTEISAVSAQEKN
jgi:CRISPR/Cas system endoribonuclease Cas6 (RAMP superfamily)